MADAASAPSPRTVTLGVSHKLYLDVARSEQWAAAVAALVTDDADVRSGAIRLFVLPSLPSLAVVSDALGAAPVALGAQDLHWHDRGAYTGGISGRDLADVGCRYVEIGHAERSLVFGEGPDIVRHKCAAAVRNGLVPVLCVGEADQMPTDDAIDVVLAQCADALSELDDAARTELVVAYEPMWAIGQPNPAPAQHVVAVCAALRRAVRADRRITDGSVIYGGSAQPGTLSLLGDGVDGLFLGRFAHDPAQFARIIDEARELLQS